MTDTDAPFLPPDTETPAGPHCTARLRFRVHVALLVLIAATAVPLIAMHAASGFTVASLAIAFALNLAGAQRYRGHLNDHA
jgi:hypothetical protein